MRYEDVVMSSSRRPAPSDLRVRRAERLAKASPLALATVKPIWRMRRKP
jgi:hypothetical protein